MRGGGKREGGTGIIIKISKGELSLRDLTREWRLGVAGRGGEDTA